MPKLGWCLPLLLLTSGAADAKGVSAALGIRMEAKHAEAERCAAQVGAVPQGAGFAGSGAVMAAFRLCMGRDLDPGAADETKMACAQKTGARYNYAAHRFTGPPRVIYAWQECAGISHDAGANDPVLSYCAERAGIAFDYAVHHYDGSPARMQAFHRCTGFAR